MKGRSCHKRNTNEGLLYEKKKRNRGLEFVYLGDDEVKYIRGPYGLTAKCIMAYCSSKLYKVFEVRSTIYFSEPEIPNSEIVQYSGAVKLNFEEVEKPAREAMCAAANLL